jgi:hypothetical protein
MAFFPHFNYLLDGKEHVFSQLSSSDHLHRVGQFSEDPRTQGYDIFSSTRQEKSLVPFERGIDM